MSQQHLWYCSNSKSTFFVHPFPISEKDKCILDWQIKRLASLGILSKYSTRHTFPVVIITHKLTKDKCPIVDFRCVNTCIIHQNTTTPFLKDIFNILGNSKCCVNVTDAFNGIRLSYQSKEYCRILPCLISPHCWYEVSSMDLTVTQQMYFHNLHLFGCTVV